MPLNRLRLDFSLQTAEERLIFLNDYLSTLNFELSLHEKETLSDYILWGKNKKNGLNSQQEDNIILKEWAPNSNTESLEGLTENPGFQEGRLKNIGSVQYKTKRIVFNRAEALEKADEYLKVILEDLFAEIDRTELVINFYELRIGKRKNPPRESLLKQFTSDEIVDIQKRAQAIDGRKYLQLRHYLVELRTEQYTYKDLIQNSIMPHSEKNIEVNEDNFRVDEDINILPFGLFDETQLMNKVFSWPVIPSLFTNEDLKKISEKMWTVQDKIKRTLDFRNPDHILALYNNYNELVNQSLEDPCQIYGAAASLVRTLNFYESIARLSDLQRELLHMKIQQKTNNEIREYINKKYNTNYNENYISTIYRQKILSTISEAAKFHEQILENIFYPENFKVCKDCKKPILRTADFFMRQKKSVDGFAPRCKECQKRIRENKKNER